MEKVKETEREKIMKGMIEYCKGKKPTQAHQRGFLAGVKFYKEL